MASIVKITVENPDEILNAGAYGAGAVIRLQSSATQAGAFADVTGTGSTPTIPVVTATRSYTGYDPAGTSTTWYRSRYENSGATRLSDWTASFQVGDETAGFLCSLYDVQQELGETDSVPVTASEANRNELIIEKIRQVSRQIENYCGRWFAPRTGTYRFHTTSGYELYFPRGIRSVTTLGIATEDQPDTGGTYVTAAATDYYIDPHSGDRTDVGDPGYWLRLRWNGAAYFYDSAFGAEVNGAFGYASVPPDIQGVAIRAVTRRFLGKSGGVAVAIGPGGSEILLPDMSGADRTTLDWYKRRAIG